MDWQAQWIWHPEADDLDNFYMLARRVIELDAPPADARLAITASALYKLYVNGEYVGRGPNPSDPSRYYYDVHPVGDRLRAGANVIAVVAYCYGPEPNPILGQNWGRGGLLAQLEAPGSADPLLVTDETWSVIEAPMWDRHAEVNCTLLGDYKERYDSRREREVAGWLDDPRFDASDWLTPKRLGQPPVEPWTRLVEREIPFLGGERLFPLNAAWESASVTYAWRDDWEVYREQNLAPDSPHGRRRREDRDRPCRVQMTHDDFPPEITLDFGREVTGYPQIEIADSAGGRIEVLYAEDAYFVRVDQFTLAGGPQTLEPFNRRTFRYMKLRFPETPGPIDLAEVSMPMDTYPVEPAGHFACSDDRLNDIWRVGRHTMRLSMLDHFVDCPWRERTLYGGDVYAENLIAHYAFGDPRLNAKGLRQIFAIQFDEGALPPWGPYRGCTKFYPAWSAFYGLAFTDHYRLTADRGFAEELWPNFVKLLDWAIGQCEAGEPYLIAVADESLAFAEWMAAEKTTIVPWQTFPFVVLLREGGELARRLGRDDEADRFTDAAEKMAAAMIEHFVSPETGLVGRIDKRGRHQSGQYDNALMLWAEVADEPTAGHIAAHLFDPRVSRIGAPFHGLFVTEGLFNAGRDAEAVDFMRRYWGGMLDRGATSFWDNFSLNWPAGAMPDRQTSLCHGWAAGPTYSLPARVLGVRPAEPGFAVVEIAPQPGGLEWASGAVPTPHGPVEVRWQRSERRFELTATLPGDCSGRFALPPINAGDAALVVDGETVELQRDPRGRTLLELDPGRHTLRLVPEPHARL